MSANLPDIDLEAEASAQDARRARGESGEAPSTGVSTASSSVMRRLGPEGPHFIRVPVTRVKLDRAGEPLTEWDEAGQEDILVFETVYQKKKICPYMLRDQAEAAKALAQIGDAMFKAALAWSHQKGEGELDLAATAELLEESYPKSVPVPGTDLFIDRPVFTEAMVSTMMTESFAQVTPDQLENVTTVIALAFGEFSPDVDDAYIAKYFDYPLAVRTIGKILFLNSAMRERFLDSSGVK